MNKKKVVALSLVLLVVFGGAGYGAYYLITHPEGKNSADTSTPQLTVSEQVQQNLEKNDKAKALSLAQSEYDKNQSAENARLLAQVNIASEKYQDAITALNSVGAANLTYDDYGQLAVAYEKSGNVKEAAAAYRKAADLWPEDNSREAETTYLRNYANYLDGNTDGI